MSKSPSSLPIEIKISTVVAISAILHSVDPIAIDAALKQMTGGVSDFFEDEFAVIDVGALRPEPTYIDWRALVDLLKKYRLNAVAVRGATPEMSEAIKARGLALDDGAGGDRAREDVAAATAASAAVTIAPVQQAAPAPAPPAPHPAQPQQPQTVALPAMIVDTPVRAGQRVYARGCDLIITAAVNNGAEIIADGSIHVYAPMHGRALAGASGNADSRIFGLSLQPELVSIAGVYRTFDDGFPAELARQPAQIRLVGDRIDISSLTSNR
ncbi:septum site-determining protein MinC [Massilia litorea]|jgi:septum site-determining protein MinC|uniref:Probable septum site-determining protein MinC n=1 Tax=Massilia litorea TaxID=2769491 RepID=A0A7L9U904_9BURK|nr:septum site-determining protein MinC [Massilia litorea]QOL50909.1 septum site-determining protein MinC [Massilia litorea]